ncbi:MAG: hypothetical protein V2A64_04595 [Candidatus Omnitrophota bacterium]
MQKTIIDIEKRIDAEEREYNKAKLQVELQKKQYDILAFENSLLTVEKSAADALKTQNKAMGDWKAGLLNTAELYKTTTVTKEQCEKVKKDIRFIRLPYGLPKEIEELLIETKVKLITAYNKRIDTLDYLLRSTNGINPDYQAKFNEGIKSAHELSSEAALSIIEAKKKIGINILEQNNNAADELPENNHSYNITGIFFSKSNPFVFINEKIYYVNDSILDGTITNILPNKITIKFTNGDRDYAIGDTIVR